jgi:hypothetical protein
MRLDAITCTACLTAAWHEEDQAVTDACEAVAAHGGATFDIKRRMEILESFQSDIDDDASHTCAEAAA